LDKDYQAYEDAKKAVETAKEKTKEAREAVKGARAAVREALKTVSDPPAVVSLVTKVKNSNCHTDASMRATARACFSCMEAGVQNYGLANADEYLVCNVGWPSCH